ncbi:S41 family peptidase [Natroniella sulfidigena]|uniref:S41 family peptidase n=1 Tax=Natroniella sulfidigena TaxID=723921 RepID=UPI00200B8809|nr:S41 family peptidase [Natroniella sulfidigena]MCK8815992.1 S41 family peptidase [Natroniella sulfidigena]
MFKSKKTIGVILILLMLSAAGITGFFLHGAEANSQEEMNQFQKLLVIFDLVRNNYVEEPELDTLLTGAIDGMLEALDDPYTGYLPPREYDDMKTSMEGEYGGVGIIITMRDDQLTIISPIEGTPGDRVGLRAEDQIMEIDGISTEGMPMDEAVDLMRGEEDTEVALSIKRAKEDDEEVEELEVEIIRELIEVEHLSSELKEDKIGYVRMSRFGEDVGQDLSVELEELKAEGAEGFILDLRSNPGGLLPEAAKVASNFIEQGSAVYVQEREGDKQGILLDPTIETVEDKPVVILVNEGSASGSEIVAGAIQDNERGMIIGNQTFGKGSVQSVSPLSDGSAVKMTTARFYTPSGNKIDQVGVEPDIVVEFDLETEADEQLEVAIEELLNKLN